MAQDDPELDFWDHLPTTWDETRCLRGEIGEFVVVARRSGNQWFVAGITGPASRVLTVRFEDFLEIAASTGTYRLHLYRDPLKDEDGGRTGVVTEVFDGLTGDDKVRLELSANGGFAMRLEPSASPA
jgi:alpha-glucosidase